MHWIMQMDVDGWNEGKTEYFPSPLCIQKDLVALWKLFLDENILTLNNLYRSSLYCGPELFYVPIADFTLL